MPVFWALAAARLECTDEVECLFDEEAAGASGWFVLRSRLTGRLLRMIDDGHGPFTSWDGIAGRAVRKSEARLRRERAAATAALGGAARCPLRPGAGAPAGWSYNGTRHAASLRRALAPWHGGGFSATATDMLFWPEMYPYANRAELPSFHLSFVGGDVWYKWQPAADDDRAGPLAVPAPGAVVPPAASADGELLRMLRRVAALVELPEVEAVAHTAALPKVPVQNPEPILAPATDPLHNDVAVPSPWSWRTIERPPAACAPLATRRSQLLLLARCERPRAGGFLGPVWRHYAPHRTALLAKSLPQLRVVLPDACTEAMPPPSEAQPLALERAWAAKATAELRGELGGTGRAAAVTEEEEDAIACGHRWVLLLDGAGPPSELLRRMMQGCVVFKEESPLAEHFYAELVPWVHYVPVAANLRDLRTRIEWVAARPAEAEAIARRAQALAARLHAWDAACFWWQLLTALAPLEAFEPRRGAGFRKLEST